MKPRISFVVQLLCAFYAASYLINKFAGVNTVNYSFFYFFAFIGIYCTLKHRLSYKDTVQDAFIKSKALYALALLLSLSVVTGIFFDNDLAFEVMAAKDFVNYLICIISFTPLCKTFFSTLFEYIFKWSSNSMKKTDAPSGSLKLFLASFAIILGCWVIVWLAYYPGLWNYDPDQVQQFINGSYNKYQPLIHTMLLGFYYSIGLEKGACNIGVILYDFIQMIIMAGIFAYTCVYIRKCISGKVFCIAVLAFYALFPVNSILAISTTKDVLFSGLVLLCVVLVLQLLEAGTITETSSAIENISVTGTGSATETEADSITKVNHKLLKKFILLAALMIACTFMLLFRNNAIYAFCMFMLCVFALGIYSKNIRFRRIFLYGVCCIILFTVSDTALTRMTDAKSGSIKEMFSVPSQQFGRIYNIINESGSDLPTLELINSYHDMEQSAYNPHLADSMKWTLNIQNSEDVMAYIKDSIKLFFRYPLVSLDSFLYLTEGAWNINDISNADIYGSGTNTRLGYLLTDVKYGYGIVHKSKLPKLELFMERAFSDNEYQNLPIISLLFSPALYWWILLICTFVFVKTKAYEYLSIAGFLWGLYLTILLGPCILIRYLYPLVVCAPVLLCMMGASIRKNNGSK